jgi:hypothetical protein
MNEIMLDLETLGTKVGCVVMQLGAVEFSNGRINYAFERNISAESCVSKGLTVDQSTIDWWQKQPVDTWRNMTSNTVPLVDALLAFNEFLGLTPRKNIMWANGASFDFPILAAAYEACGMRPPWAFYNERCFRTIKNIFPAPPMEANTNLHDALSDASHQALALMAIRAQHGFDVEKPSAWD